MILEELVLRALKARGAVRARYLNREERYRIEELEESYSRTITPWGRPVNLGVMECLRRRHVIALLTAPHFTWPPGPYALLKAGRVVVGEVTSTGLQLYRDRLRRARGEWTVVYLSLKFPELEELDEEAVAASPSPVTHRYLETLLGGGRGMGTLLVGLNSLKSYA